ncbi:MAG TPA: hypothetical protein PKK00_00035 [Bacteroidales bacterium]|nr:hypothetical protein [Bacteroidales bacterium]HPS16295.1 hypothetical protein [Bacteroidales bacterium]
MKEVHVECKPDELLVSMLGCQKKMITHHQGKSRVFSALCKTKNQRAMVDEDPDSPKTSYEKELKLTEESNGIKYYVDKLGNKICFLNGKLEDWIIFTCKQHKIKLSNFGLPDNPEELHDIINYRLSNFEKLLNELIEKNVQGIIKLKEWLN